MSPLVSVNNIFGSSKTEYSNSLLLRDFRLICSVYWWWAVSGSSF